MEILALPIFANSLIRKSNAFIREKTIVFPTKMSPMGFRNLTLLFTKVRE